MNKQQIAKNSIFLSIRMIVVMLLSFFTTRFLLSNLGIEDYGVYNVTLGIVALCTFLMPALSNANQRFHNFELEKHGVEGGMKVFNTGLLIQFLMIVIIVLICETVGLWYVKEKLVVPEGRENAAFWIYQISVIAIIINMLQIPFISAVLAHEHMNFYAVVNVFDAVLKLIIAALIAYSSYDKLVFFGFLLLSINILNLLIYVYYAKSNFAEVRIRFLFNHSLLKEMLTFSGWNLFETIARIGKDQGGNLLLNFFFGPVLNASRGIAHQVSYAFTSLVESTIMASRPQMVNSYVQGEIHTALSMFDTLSKGVLFIIFTLSLPVFFEVDFILKLWLGENIPAYSVEFVRLSIIIILVDKLASPVTALLHATGKIRRYHLFSGLINFSVIPISYVFLKYGCSPLIVYVVTFCAAAMAQVVFVFEVKRILPEYRLKTYINNVVGPFILVVLFSSIIPIIFFEMMDNGFSRFVFVAITSIVFTTGSIYYFGLNSKERYILISLVIKRTDKAK